MRWRMWYVVFWMTWVSCRQDPHAPDLDEFPRVKGFSGERWPIPAESPVEITFSRPVMPVPAGGVHLLAQKDVGACNPACPGTCHAGRCFLSRVDEAFLVDASRGGLSPSRAAGTVELEWETKADRLLLKPRWGSMWPAWRYDLVLTPAIRDLEGRPLLDAQEKMAAFSLEFSTPPADDLAAEAIWLAPMRDARGVPQNLAFIALRLPGEGAMGPGIFILAGPDGEIHELTAEPFLPGCAGEPAGCGSVLLRVPAMLRSETRYELRAIRRVRLEGGRYLLPWMRLGAFSTGELAWLYPPKWHLEDISAVTGCTHVAGRLDGEALLWLEDASGPRTGTQWVRDGLAELALAGREPFRVHVMGLEGSHELGGFVPAAAESENFIPGPVLVRVFPNPSGPEPAQEFVEVFNASQDPVELEGYELTDSLEKSGDLLPAHRLEPGARVRIAGKGYACDLPGEPPCDTDVMILGSSLASGGLGNGGEPLYLFNPWGELASRYGGWLDTAKTPGASVWRASPAACDVPASWHMQ